MLLSLDHLYRMHFATFQTVCEGQGDGEKRQLGNSAAIGPDLSLRDKNIFQKGGETRLGISLREFFVYTYDQQNIRV